MTLEQKKNDLREFIKDYKKCRPISCKLASDLLMCIEALEFMTMPLTTENHTISGLLETINTDIARGTEALSQITKD